MKDDLVGTKEIATMLGCSPQYVYKLRLTKKDFPKPIAKLAQGPVWRRRDIEGWKKKKELS